MPRAPVRGIGEIERAILPRFDLPEHTGVAERHVAHYSDGISWKFGRG